MTLREAAAVLQMHPGTLQSAVRNGNITAARVRENGRVRLRFDEAEVRRYQFVRDARGNCVGVVGSQGTPLEVPRRVTYDPVIPEMTDHVAPAEAGEKRAGIEGLLGSLTDEEKAELLARLRHA